MIRRRVACLCSFPYRATCTSHSFRKNSLPFAVQYDYITIVIE